MPKDFRDSIITIGGGGGGTFSSTHGEAANGTNGANNSKMDAFIEIGGGGGGSSYNSRDLPIRGGNGKTEGG